MEKRVTIELKNKEKHQQNDYIFDHLSITRNFCAEEKNLEGNSTQRKNDKMG